jgi:hypothetical protein
MADEEPPPYKAGDEDDGREFPIKVDIEVVDAGDHDRKESPSRSEGKLLPQGLNDPSEDVFLYGTK